MIETQAIVSMTSKVYELSCWKGDGSLLEMKDLAGKVVYATNVASL